MAANFLLLFSSLLLSLFSSSSSRILPPPNFPKTSTLNLTSSTLHTRNALNSSSLKHHSNLTHQKSLTLHLHSRDSIAVHKLHHKDYKSLVLTRLARDSARVKSIQTRVELALKQVKKSDLQPLNEDLQSEALEAPIISGAGLGSGEYFTRVGVGRPAKEMYVVVDTGSDVSWIQCQPCSDCYQQSDPIFDPAGSGSYYSLSCLSPRCSALDISECRSGRCLYEVSYGDGSYSVGDFVTETISFNGVSLNDIALGCGHNNEGLFVGAAGLLGLGGGNLSFPSQIRSSSFSYCLVDRDSEAASTLEFNSNIPPDAITAPLVRNNEVGTFRYVEMTGVSVGGEMLEVPPSAFRLDEAGGGGIIVDSGTAVTRLDAEVYESLREAFKRGTGNLPTASGVALFDTCYDLASLSTVEVPAVALHFPGGKSWQLPAKNYLIPVDSGGTYCLAFAPTTSSPSIIGNVQQQGTRVGFDLANSLVGFSPNKC